MCVFHCFYVEKYGLRKMLGFLIKSCFLWRSHQIHLKFAAWIHCIIRNIWVLTGWYVLSFFCNFSVFITVFYLEKCGLEKKSNFPSSSHQIHIKFATWIHCIIPINICKISTWYFSYFLYFWLLFFFSLFLLWKMWPEKKLLRFLIKLCFLCRSHQIHFKFTAWFHCILLINMWVFTSWYILLFFCIVGVFITVST